jgi:hypothetical protein
MKASFCSTNCLYHRQVKTETCVPSAWCALPVDRLEKLRAMEAALTAFQECPSLETLVALDECAAQVGYSLRGRRDSSPCQTENGKSLARSLVRCARIPFSGFFE